MARRFPAPFFRHPFWISLALFILIIVICEIIGWPFLRTPTESFIADRLQRQVKLDKPFKIHFFGGIRIQAGHLWVSAPEVFGAPYLIEASNTTLKLRYSDMMAINNDKTAPIRIKELLVEQADAYFIRHADGTSTWQFDKNTNEPSRPAPAIENLVVQDGTVLVQDPLTDSDLKVYFKTEEGEGQEATSKVGASGKFRKLPLKAELVTSGFMPIAVQDKNSKPSHSKGWVEYGGVRVDYDGSVSDIFGEKNIKGNLTVKGPSLSTFGLLVNTILPTTAPFSLKGTIEKSGNLWESTITSANVGRSDLSGHFKYDPRPNIPVLTGSVKGKRFYLADLAPVFGASGDDKGQNNMSQDAAGNKVSSDKIFPDRPLDLPSLNRMNANVTFDLDYVELGKAFNKPIAPFKAELDLNKGKMSLAKVSAKTADGTLAGTISVDAHEAADNINVNKNPKKQLKPAEWRIALQWKDINLEKWLQVSEDRKQAALNEGKKEVPPAYITGNLSGKMNLAGKGNSTAELLGSMDGDVSLYIRNGTLSHLIIEAMGLDVAQALGVMVKGDQSLPMQCAVMNLKAKNGIVAPDVALVDTPVTLMLIDGNMSLEQEKYNLRVIAKPKNVSPFTLRSPILVKGTFVNPVVSVEAGPIAARALGAIALAFINPLAAILPFIDPGSGNESSSCSEALAEFNKATGKTSAKSPTKSTATPPIKTITQAPEGRIPGR